MRVHHGNNPIMGLSHNELGDHFLIPKETFIGPLPDGLSFLSTQACDTLESMSHVIGMGKVEEMGGQGLMQELKISILVFLLPLGQDGAGLQDRNYGHFCCLIR